ncbi:MAG: LacI family DNA-binding transcriptional regulator [Kiritimatiellae bacterium]|nr:LacI family DNA-binding transcriptional regulator [Kiritimatiellia bacterium]
MPAKRVTQADVATHCGLSQETVSQALRGAGRMREETRSLVKRAAARLGYRPHALARAMRAGRFGTAGLLLGSRPGFSHLPTNLLFGIQQALAVRNLHLTVTVLPDEALTDEQTLPKVFKELTVDGLLINYTHRIPRQMPASIRAMRIPAVWLNTKRLEDCVYPDDRRLAADATDVLLECGYRPILFAARCDTPGRRRTQHYSQADRQAGYETSARRAGLQPRSVPVAELGPDTVRQLIRQRSTGVPAVVAYEMREALRTLYAAQAAGLKAPDDLLIVYFSHAALADDELDNRMRPIFIPEAQLGQRAVETLLQKIEAPNVPIPARTVRIDKNRIRANILRR